MKVMFFDNGNTMVFDDNGEQIPKLQKSYLRSFIYLLVENNIDPTAVEFTMPNGSRVNVFKTDNGYNWDLKF